jgi:hypothetical protein
MFYKMFEYGNEILFLLIVKLSAVQEMKWNLVKVIIFCTLISLTSSQFWDVSLWGDEDERNDDESSEENNSELWIEMENEESSMKLIKMSSTQIKEEKDLLEHSSEMIVNEIANELHDDLIEANMHQISEIISERTVELFNVLHAIKSHDEKQLNNINDIFIWNNDSTDKINEIIESYYNVKA